MWYGRKQSDSLDLSPTRGDRRPSCTPACWRVLVSGNAPDTCDSKCPQSKFTAQAARNPDKSTHWRKRYTEQRWSEQRNTTTKSRCPPQPIHAILIMSTAEMKIIYVGRHPDQLQYKAHCSFSICVLWVQDQENFFKSTEQQFATMDPRIFQDAIENTQTTAELYSLKTHTHTTTNVNESHYYNNKDEQLTKGSWTVTLRVSKFLRTVVSSSAAKLSPWLYGQTVAPVAKTRCELIKNARKLSDRMKPPWTYLTWCMQKKKCTIACHPFNHSWTVWPEITCKFLTGDFW